MNLWQQVGAWVQREETVVGAALSKDEQELIALVKPLWTADEASLMQDLATFSLGVVGSIEGATTKTLPDLETAVMNSMLAGGSNLLATVEAMGSNLFQAFLGLVQAKFKAVPDAPPKS